MNELPSIVLAYYYLMNKSMANNKMIDSRAPQPLYRVDLGGATVKRQMGPFLDLGLTVYPTYCNSWNSISYLGKQNPLEWCGGRQLDHRWVAWALLQKSSGGGGIEYLVWHRMVVWHWC